MTSSNRRPLVQLPKAHLHVHLEGAMRPSTLRELCERQGSAPPPIATTYGSFADFQELYVAARGALRSRDDLVRLVDEVVADAAADGAVWIEPAVNLSEYLGLGSYDEVLDLLVAAGGEAGSAHGVGVGWLVTADRTMAAATAIEQASWSARYAGNGVVSFGLANDEAAGAPEPFAPAFAIAREAGIISAPHAGEHGGPESVRGRSTPSAPTGSSTASGPWRTPTSWPAWPTRGSARRVPDLQRGAVGRPRPGRPPAAGAARGGGALQHQRRRPVALRDGPSRRVHAVSPGTGPRRCRAGLVRPGLDRAQRRPTRHQGPCPSGHRRLVGVVVRHSRVNSRSTVAPTWARVATGSSALATSMAASFRAARRRWARGWTG